MIVYLIKVTLCALLFYAMYVLLLERENMHRFKRIYLLGSLVFSMIVPFTAMTINMPQMPANIGTIYTGWEKTVEITDHQTLIVEPAMQVDEIPAAATVNYSLLILCAYVLITALFLFRLFKNCWRMLAHGRKNACTDYHGAKIALMDEKTVPHSFGRYIFINRNDYDNGRIPDEIMRHEWTHIRQRHTWDIVFIELLIAFGWFNPVFYLYRNKIRQNHEFLADDAVIRNNQEFVPVYQTILMNSISQNKNVNFTSNFNLNFLTTKKRIVMMTKTTSKKRAWCRSIALIPVFIAAICVFSTCKIAQNDANTLISVENPILDDDRMITYGEGVSLELLTEYQEIAGKYLEKHTTGDPDESEKLYWNTNFLPEEDWTRLYVIFFQMTEEQKQEQSITFYGGPMGERSGPYPPNQRRYDSWKEDKKCHIWIDGEKVDNDVLNSHTISDFDAYFVSSFLGTGNRYESRVDLWTKAGYEKLRLHFYKQPVSIKDLLEIEPTIYFLVEKDKEKHISLSRNPQNGWLLSTFFYNSNYGMVKSPAPTPLLYHQDHEWIYSSLCNFCP